jgi:hypothetical protein
MTETPEPATQPTSVAAAPPAPVHEPVKSPRLFVVAAWVVIVAGILFILSTIFFAGAMVFGISHHCHHHHHGMMYGPGGPGGPGGGPWQYGPGGPGMVVTPFGPPPGFGPGGPGGPSQSPTTSAPAPNTPATPRP